MIYTANGVATTLSPTAYSVMLNPVLTGQLWSVGGSITYPLSGPPIASGTTLTISRILPLTQQAEISNQSNQYPVVTEQALDTLCMEIQQVAARTGQQRGTWISGATYSFGDVVQDGVNGANSNNYYMCAIANTSSVWATDLAAGDWSLAIQASIPVTPLPIPVVDGGTGATTAGAALNNLGGISLAANNTYTGANNFTGGSILVPTVSPSDSSTKASSTAFVAAVKALLLGIFTPQITKILSGSGTYTVPANTVYLRVRMVGGGGGGGGSSDSTANGGAGGGGGASTFGTSLLSAGGGGGANGGGAVAGGGGGTSSLGGATGFALTGGNGGGGQQSNTTSVYAGAGVGGSSAFGGAAGYPASNNPGISAASNTGGGGSGSTVGGLSQGNGGAGGGGGGYVEAWIFSPLATYSYSVGVSGTAGTAGTNGYAGGAGGSGIILIEAY